MTIHWCGTGLSAVPGLRRLLEAGADVVVWNRTIAKAQAAVGDLTDDIRPYDLKALSEALAPGDIAVSMLPATEHVAIATACLDAGAQFVSSSYISPEMRALDERAQELGVSLVNEVGLDPGIDHLMAHALMLNYSLSDVFDPENTHSFTSYCGGIPKYENPFKYKFSWSPLGVLTALRSPSRSISEGEELTVDRPWDAISSYEAPLPTPESFEVYPNRDSLPFMEEYGLGEDWNIQQFVRGTLRLNGWSEAWADVFREIETLSGPEGDARLKEMSDQFWAENAYEDDEPDRVVMCVSLKVERDGETLWHETYTMDAWGDERGTAMARLVSVPVSLAVQAVQAGLLEPGVQAAPSELEMVSGWMAVISTLAQHVEVVDHLA